jgi:hypothetical protein
MSMSLQEFIGRHLMEVDITMWIAKGGLLGGLPKEGIAVDGFLKPKITDLYLSSI